MVTLNVCARSFSLNFIVMHNPSKDC